jgi:hypothetical protein
MLAGRENDRLLFYKKEVNMKIIVAIIIARWIYNINRRTATTMPTITHQEIIHPAAYQIRWHQGF